jgi:sec-independent protein translocase protein TatA
MPNLGFQELMVVVILGLLVFGPKRLPEVGRQVGRTIRQFRDATSTVRSDLGVDDLARDVNDIKANLGVDDLKAAVGVADLKSAVGADSIKSSIAVDLSGQGAPASSAAPEGAAPQAPAPADVISTDLLPAAAAADEPGPPSAPDLPNDVKG